jgi:hypothetical protein
MTGTAQVAIMSQGAHLQHTLQRPGGEIGSEHTVVRQQDIQIKELGLANQTITACAGGLMGW